MNTSKNLTRKGKHYDLSGMTFSRLMVNSFAGTDKHNRALWKCTCECGESTIVASTNLLKGYVKSCGCLSRELKHGLRIGANGKVTNLYNVWAGIKSRCLNPKNTDYQYYGGRGIKVCDQWLDYRNFHEWATNSNYEPGLTIERKDVNGDYDPNNCTWIPFSEQAINKRYEHSRHGARGVSWHKASHKWYARVGLGSKIVWHGLFTDFNDACKAVELARKNIFKEE